MEFLRVARRRSLVSESVYVLLNVALAAAVFGLVVATDSPWLAIGLVVLSKWRVFAVRPRFWIAHIEANVVDSIVSIGTVILMYLAGQGASDDGLIAQMILAVFFGIWLLAIKPRSKRSYMVLQAGVALLVGTMTLASISYELPSSLFVAMLWIVGYASARHVLSTYSEKETRFLSLVWGFTLATIGWIYFHWMIAYTLPFMAGLQIPQLTLAVLALSFVAERVYASYAAHDKVRRQDVLMPIIFTISLMVVLLFTRLNQVVIGVM